MVDTALHDAWQAGDSYDRYMGRWSRQIAPPFLAWLGVPGGRRWLDIGCGTGALTAAIVARHQPDSVVAVDPSAGFLEKARANVPDPRVEFRLGDAQELPVASGDADVVVSALVLNFVPDRAKALAEMKRAARPGGIIAFYVWDYPGAGVEFMRAFWAAAASLDPDAGALSEDRRFPFCTPDGLRGMSSEAGLTAIDITAIEMPSVFNDFDDYWHPFTLGAGPAPGYCKSLPAEARERLREKLARELPRQPDGSIHFTTRAWALRARSG